MTLPVEELYLLWGVVIASLVWSTTLTACVFTLMDRVQDLNNRQKRVEITLGGLPELDEEKEND